MAYTTINDSSAYFQSTLYSGDSNNSTVITNTGYSNLQPDFIWIKSRTHGSAGTGGHMKFDSSRGIKSTTGSDSPFLVANSTSGDQTNSNGLQAVSTDSFTPGSMTRTNETGDDYVAWQWKANGGTTTSVSASGTGSGCINACTHQANTTAGFSIITYTGRDDQLNNGQHSILKHGLGVAPTFMIVKRRDDTSNWYVMGKHVTSASAYSNNEYLSLNTTSGINGNSYTGSVAPTSTDIYLGNELVNVAGATYVMYAFTDVQGYSKFGKYVGNGNSNGPFVHTGFRPAFVMVKNNAAVNMWNIYDSVRPGYNDDLAYMFYGNGPNAEYAGASYHDMDLYSNGFKIRLTDASQNGNGNDHIYMAFAENPFVTSTGVPCTAR